jgi:hypothetical protein
MKEFAHSEPTGALPPPRFHAGPSDRAARSDGALPRHRRPHRRELEVVLLARHAGDDPADPGPPAEPLVEGGDQQGLAAGWVAEGKRREHSSRDATGLRHQIRGDDLSVVRTLLQA